MLSRPILLAALVSASLRPLTFSQFEEGCVAIHTLTGEAAGDQFGWVSNCVGDIDGDGTSDMIITAVANDAGGMTAGRVYLYSGATGELIYHLTGQAAGWALGHDGGPAGYIDDDDVPDLIVGAPGDVGRAVVYSGVDGTVLHIFEGEASGDNFGTRVAGGGDLDGDGTTDLIIGAAFHDTAGDSAGRAYVYSGADFSLLWSRDGAAAGHRFGQGVAFVGDLTGDGRDEILVGAPGGGGGGLAYVYTFDGIDDELVHTLDPSGEPSVNFGQWFMNGGLDVDGDGVGDIYVGDFSANRAHIFSGADGERIYAFSGDGGGGFGIGRLVEDVNGDGRADAVLAAWQSSVGAGLAGKAFLYSGIDGSVLRTWTHTVQGAALGFDANGMGDVDGDGVDDYLLTAALDSGATGRAYLVTGADPAPLIGDIDQDCDVDFTDLVKLTNEWGPCDDPESCRSDLDGDGSVGLTDLLLLLVHWTG